MTQTAFDSEATMATIENSIRTLYKFNSANQMQPFIMLFDQNGKLGETVFLNITEDRSHAISEITVAVIATQSFGYVFASEAWMAMQDKGEDMTVMPSKNPKRQEVLIVECDTFLETNTRLYSMQRDQSGQLTDLVLLDDLMNGTVLESRFDIFKAIRQANPA